MDASIEMELDRSIRMQRWPAGTASKVGLLNLGTPPILDGALKQEHFISTDVKLPNGLMKKFNEEMNTQNL